jgi:hypothetical protein
MEIADDVIGKKVGRTGLKRTRWVFRCNAAINDEPNEVTTRETHAAFLETKLKEYCDTFAFQLESAPSTGYLHYQGYFELMVRNRFQWIQNNLRKFEYLAFAKGTPKQAWLYCTKEETRVAGPWIYGEPRAEENANKSEGFVKLCRTGADDDKLYDEYPSMMTTHRHTPEHIRSLHPPERTNPLEVYLFYGPPGTGKTDFAYEQASLLKTEPYEVPLGKDFWLTPSAYGKKFVIIDEFKSNLSLKDLLKLLDKRPIQVPVKGSFVWWCPEFIIITTNKNPWEWYTYVDRDFEREALFRRLHYTFVFEKNAEGVPKPKEVTLESLKPELPQLQLEVNKRWLNFPEQKKPAVMRKQPEVTRPAPYSWDHKTKSLVKNVMVQPIIHSGDPEWLSARQTAKYQPVDDVTFDEIDYSTPYGGFF